ncbi:MAG TPA: MarR family transcriptional regulator [Stellaceae bacterium]|nr:MarR family transcriptional regulator [Stellaceae bacterium]
MGGRALRSVARAAPSFEIESHVFYLFTQILGRRNVALAEKLKPLGVSVPQWRILAVLQERAGCTMSELAGVTTIDRTTLTRAVDRMVETGLVARRNDAQDRRSVRLSLTAAGKDAFRRVLPRVLEQNERAMRDFTASEITEFRAQLHRMVRNLDPDYDHRKAAWRAGRAAAIAENRHNRREAS